MNPTDLTDEEMLALICLSRVMVAADGQLGVEEMEELNEIGMDLGVEAFTRVSKLADAEVNTTERALELAANVDRADAREMILTMLGDLAGVDGVDDSERQFLAEVRSAWG